MSAAFYILLLKTLAALSWASSLSGPEAVREFLAVPDAEKLLNSVLGRLEHDRQPQRFAHETECDEVNLDSRDLILPEYTETIQSGRERDLDQVVGQKHFAICNLKKKIRRLNTNEYEYRPAYYEEVFCVPSGEENGATNEVCSGLGLSCVQWNKTIHLTRRRYTRQTKNWVLLSLLSHARDFPGVHLQLVARVKIITVVPDDVTVGRQELW